VPAAPPGAAALLVIPALFWAGILGTRLTMALPARAVGHNGINFRAIWARTAGNTWRIGFGFLLCVLPIALVTQALVTGTLMARMPDPKDSEAVLAWLSSMAVPNGIMVAILTLSNMVGIAFLSLAYRHFFGPQPDERLQVRRG
jgi:membrane-anchored glycerophosphoryl diester phosphodiesterase (GDPDase)